MLEFIVDVADMFEQKLKAVGCYRSQFDEARFEKVRHFVTGTAVALGGRCGFAYGEFFALPASVETSDLVSLVHGGKGPPAPVTLPGQPAPPLRGAPVTPEEKT